MALELRDDAQNREAAEAVEALKRGDFPLAFSLADGALRRGAPTPALFNVRAICHQESGRYAEALADFECARAAFPHDAHLLHSIGDCLFRLGQFPRAVAVLDRAIAIAPQSAETNYLRALALQSAREVDASERALERTLALEPNHADASTRLATIKERRGESSEALRLAERALALDTGRTDAALVVIRTLIDERNYELAEHQLRAILDDANFVGAQRVSALGLLGDVLDFQDRPAEAFAMYTAANDACRALYAPDYAVGRAVDNVRGIAAYFEKTDRWPASELPVRSGDEPASHAFLLGFMRSGTTLLESILASSPQTVASDERDFLHDAAQNFLGSNDGLERLKSLGADQIDRWRRHYLREARNKTGSLAGRLFLDKLPFNSVKLPLLARLFPEARVVFAIRDPRDVVLSVFRNRFAVSPDTYEFLQLRDCANYYESVMRLADFCFRKLPLNVLRIRYEDLVENFEERVRAVCEFVNIDWEESMRGFRRGVQSINIGSVSAPQVRRGLYKGATGQWRRYREQLDPVLPILQPWVETLGYPSE